MENLVARRSVAIPTELPGPHFLRILIRNIITTTAVTKYAKLLIPSGFVGKVEMVSILSLSNRCHCSVDDDINRLSNSLRRWVS